MYRIYLFNWTRVQLIVVERRDQVMSILQYCVSFPDPEKRAQAVLEEEDDPTVSELHLKKRGRKLRLGDKLELMVQRYIADTQKVGGAVSTAVVRAGARGISLIQDRSRLAEFGGPATLSKAWPVLLLRRMNYTKRRSITKCYFTKRQITAVFLGTLLGEFLPVQLIYGGKTMQPLPYPIFLPY